MLKSLLIFSNSHYSEKLWKMKRSKDDDCVLKHVELLVLNPMMKKPVMKKKKVVEEVALEVILLLHPVAVPVLNVPVNPDVKVSRKTSWMTMTMKIFTVTQRRHHRYVLELRQLNTQIPRNLSLHAS